MAETKVQFESQKERWIKYGANVAIASIVVILLAGLVVYLAQKKAARIDTTESRAYSLKPQTLNILNDVKGKTKLISLYRDEVPEKGVLKKSPYAPVVADLLDEYHRHSSKIDVEVIDPVQNNAKVESLISEVASKYGGEVQKYKQVTDSYSKAYDEIKKIATAETQKVTKLPVDKLPQDDDSQLLGTAVLEVQRFTKELSTSSDAIQRTLADKPPNYKGATDEISERAQWISDDTSRIIEIFGKAKDLKNVPPEIKSYVDSAKPTYEQIKKLADDLAKQTKGLGELKLDDLRTSLKAKDTILVVGDNDMRVIPFDQVWKVDDKEIKQMAPGQELKPRFAGEQQISTAILALNQQKKQKVVFVRNGGAPVAEPGQFPFRRGGPLSVVADRLRDYNFQVMEKDLSGMYAMQAQMQQQPVAPEPSDEEIKDAIWVVLAFPTQQQNPMMPQQPTMGPKVQDHLNAGGSALIIFAPQVDNMTDVLKPWGIEVHSDAVACHDVIAASEGRQGDQYEEAQRYPFVFNIREYGDHPITKPLRSLDSMLLPILTVKTSPAAGVKTTPIIPIPESPKSWGETDIDALQNGDAKFDAAKDIAGPIAGGAVAEKDKGGRLVVIASATFAFDRYVNEPDPDMLRRGLVVSRFPANGELFANSIFWLAKMEPMIAISPAAMEVARIEPISTGALRFWQNGALLVLLPGIVVLAGGLVWYARRD